MEIEHDFIVKFLKIGKYKIKFTKKDGTVREMVCTLDEKYIPKSDIPVGKSRHKTKDVVSVYDLEKNGWRSFRVNSLKDIIYYV